MDQRLLYLNLVNLNPNGGEILWKPFQTSNRRQEFSEADQIYSWHQIAVVSDENPLKTPWKEHFFPVFAIMFFKDGKVYDWKDVTSAARWSKHVKQSVTLNIGWKVYHVGIETLWRRWSGALFIMSLADIDLAVADDGISSKAVWYQAVIASARWASLSGRQIEQVRGYDWRLITIEI